MKLSSRIRNLVMVAVPLAAVMLVAGNAHAESVAGASPSSSVLAAQGNHVRQHRLTGVVTSISSTSWTIGGQTFAIDTSTQVGSGIAVGATVKVVYYVSSGQNVATKITLVSPATIPVSYSGTIQPILNANCVTCHSWAGSYAGVTSNGRVIAGDAAKSPLYQKAASGMGGLSQSQLGSLQDWINQGALNN